MSSPARPCRKGDRAASIIILAALAAIGLAVYLMGHANVEETAAFQAPDDAPASPLPPRLLETYALESASVYGPDDLYEYIDGQAPLFIEFGFKALFVGEYDPAAPDAPPLVLELYDMAARRNAYGIFNDSRPLEDDPIPLGNSGFHSGNVAGFWKGPFYVRVSAPVSQDAAPLVGRAAAELAASIQDESRTLREFEAFPREGLVEGSLAFTKTAAFGLEHLGDVFSGEYEQGGRHYHLFFVAPDASDRNEQTLEEHARFLKADGHIEDEGRDESEAWLWGTEKYTGPSLLVQRGDVIAGCIGLSDRSEAGLAARALADRVRALFPSTPQGMPDAAE